MGKTGQKVLDEALQLELSERAELAAELLASLDGEPDEDVELRGQPRSNDVLRELGPVRTPVDHGRKPVTERRTR